MKALIGGGCTHIRQFNVVEGWKVDIFDHIEICFRYQFGMCRNRIIFNIQLILFYKCYWTN